jgi:hypothetical protein
MKLFYTCLSLLATLATTATAHAQIATRPLPPTRPVGIIFQSEVGKTTGNSREDDRLTQAAITAVEQSLRQLGYTVIPRAEVIQKLIDSGINCPSGVQNCEPRDVLSALDLGGVVLVAIWWNRTPADITIEVTSADAVGTAKGKLAADVNEHVPALVASALQDLKNGKAVELQINTLPLGAEVRLDGQLLGTAPVTGRAIPGAHEIIVSYPDYVTTSQHLDVPRGADDPLPVHIALERTTGSKARTERVPLVDPNPAPVWDYALGGGLGVLGAVLAVTPLLTLARGGDCADGTNNVACQRVHFGTRAGLQLAGSVLALAGATYLFVATPIRASLSTDGESAYAQLSASF